MTPAFGFGAPFAISRGMTERRFPPPWTVDALDGGFKIVDSNGQTLAYVYGHADPRDALSPRR